MTRLACKKPFNEKINEGVHERMSMACAAMFTPQNDDLAMKMGYNKPTVSAVGPRVQKPGL